MKFCGAAIAFCWRNVPAICIFSYFTRSVFTLELMQRPAKAAYVPAFVQFAAHNLKANSVRLVKELTFSALQQSFGSFTLTEIEKNGGSVK